MLHQVESARVAEAGKNQFTACELNRQLSEGNCSCITVSLDLSAYHFPVLERVGEHK